MENYLNIIHFCLYKVHYKSHIFAKKLNPFNIIHKLPFQKRRYEKLGIDIHKEIDKAFGDKNFGLSITIAGGILWGEIAVFFSALILCLNISLSVYYIVACCVLSGLVCYFFVFRDDKYIEYFDKYEKWSKAEKRKYYCFTLTSVVIVFFLFSLGLIW